MRCMYVGNSISMCVMIANNKELLHTVTVYDKYTCDSEGYEWHKSITDTEAVSCSLTASY